MQKKQIYLIALITVFLSVTVCERVLSGIINKEFDNAIVMNKFDDLIEENIETNQENIINYEYIGSEKISDEEIEQSVEEIIPKEIKKTSKGFKKSTKKFVRKVDNRKYPKIAIVLDDAGEREDYEDKLVNLSTNLVFAVIPELEDSISFYKKLSKKRYEVIIHMPMEPYDMAALNREKTVLFVTNSSNEIYEKLNGIFKNYPYVKGMNNHTGSKATSDETLMKHVINFSASNNLYFLDSFTISSSVGYKLALEKNIPTAKRDVFLDNKETYKYTLQQFEILVEKAKKNGSAIGIGHYNRKTTYLVLKDVIPKLKSKYGVELVKLSELLEYENIRN